jgi:hypothetical protein
VDNPVGKLYLGMNLQEKQKALADETPTNASQS